MRVAYLRNRSDKLEGGSMERLFNDPEWQACFESFIRAVFAKSGSEQSFDTYSRALIAFYTDPDRTPDSYTRQECEVFIRHPSRSKRNAGKLPTQSTMNQRLAILNSWYAHCATYCTISAVNEQPTPILTKPAPTLGLKFGAPNSRLRVFTEAELEALFGAMDKSTIMGARDFAIFSFFLYTAKRREEIARLRFGDIEACTIVDVDGRSRPGYTFAYYAKGSARTQRKQELPQPCWDALQHYLKIAGREDIKGDDPLFLPCRPPRGGGPKITYGQALNSWNMARSLKRYALKAGIANPEECHLHMLRHTSARLRFELNGDIRAVSRILGHSSIASTDVYLRQISGVSDSAWRGLESKLSFLGK